MSRKLPEFDRGVASLIADLQSHGLLESTIVWVGGEFGRTPRIQFEAPWFGGRSHYGKAFSVLLAGGGFKGGTVVGSTDSTGENVVERPIYPWDLIASMYELLGIDKNTKLPHPQAATAYVTPFAAGDTPPKETGGMLKEIM
jgi:arylsulfatase A-like enzyme